MFAGGRGGEKGRALILYVSFSDIILNMLLKYIMHSHYLWLTNDIVHATNHRSGICAHN